MAEKIRSTPTHHATTPTRPPIARTKTDSTLRESPLIQRWGKGPVTPPGSRLVSSPSWTHFDTSPTPTPPKSPSDVVLQPWYNPPASERLPPGTAGAGLPKPLKECKKTAPSGYVNRPHRPIPESMSWATVSPGSVFSENASASTNTSAGSPTHGVSFQRQMVKRVNTESLLTASFKTSPLKAAMKFESMSPGMLAAKDLSADKLPSPFDSDSEDEDEAVDKGAVRNAKGGGERHVEKY